MRKILKHQPLIYIKLHQKSNENRSQTLAVLKQLDKALKTNKN
jgi:hypothetical protein